MLGSGKFDLSGGDGNQFTHEQNVDSVENDSDNVLGLSNLFKLGNIGLFDGSDSTFGFLEIRKGNFEISVSLRSFDLNLISLFLTSDGNTVDFLRFLIGVPVLNLELLQKFVGAFGGFRKFDVLNLEYSLEVVDIFGGFIQFVETLGNVLFFQINGAVLLVVQFLVRRNEREIRFGGNVDVSAHLLEVHGAHSVDQFVNYTHMVHQFELDGRFAINFDLGEELGRHRNEGFLGPGQEPIDGARGEERGELLGTLSEFGGNGREGKHQVESVLDARHEVVPQDSRVRVFTLLAQTSLHELILALHWHQFFIVFTQKARNFTC